MRCLTLAIDNAWGGKVTKASPNTAWGVRFGEPHTLEYSAIQQRPLSSAFMNKKPLQITMGMLALIPVASGSLALMGVDDPLYLQDKLPAVPILDSNLRFYAGIWLALGLAMWSILPRIEQHAPVFRLIWGGIFLGGLGRLLSILLMGMPPAAFIAFTVLEIIGAPAFIWWHHQVAKSHRAC